VRTLIFCAETSQESESSLTRPPFFVIEPSQDGVERYLDLSTKPIYKVASVCESAAGGKENATDFVSRDQIGSRLQLRARASRKPSLIPRRRESLPGSRSATPLYTQPQYARALRTAEIMLTLCFETSQAPESTLTKIGLGILDRFHEGGNCCLDLGLEPLYVP
jgi:hypothetical protein